MIPTANSFGGCIIHFGGCDLHFRGYTLHSWRVRFAFWGVHLHFGGYTLHSWRVRLHFGGYTCILGGTLCTLYIHCILGGCTFTLGGALCIFGVYLSFWIVGALCFLGIALIINKFMDGDSYYGYTAFLDRNFVLECIHISMYTCPHYYTSWTRPMGSGNRTCALYL